MPKKVEALRPLVVGPLAVGSSCNVIFVTAYLKAIQATRK